LRDFKFDGTIRVSFSSLSSKSVPGFRAISIALVTKPTVTFDIGAAGTWCF
jgi:hypothetical protein